MFKFFILVFLLVNCWLYSATTDELTRKLKNCFETCWSIDSNTASYLGNYFKSNLDSAEGRLLIEDFIQKSQALQIQFPLDKKLADLSLDDGVIQATKFHPVVFENPYVRIMAGCAEPGEREPFHTHVWKSLLVVFEEAEYFVEYAKGKSEYLHLKPGVYELPPEDLYACTNIGRKKENCLRFEVKD